MVLPHGGPALQIGKTVSLNEVQFSISEDTCNETWKPKQVGALPNSDRSESSAAGRPSPGVVAKNGAAAASLTRPRRVIGMDISPQKARSCFSLPIDRPTLKLSIG
jgi:hypothetical protein